MLLRSVWIVSIHVSQGSLDALVTAGELIARTGVERPTSRHATIYLHRTRKLSALPAGSPIEDTVEAAVARLSATDSK